MPELADPLITRFYPVSQLRHDLADTVSFDLDLPEPVPFLPGQFNMLYVFGQGEVPISISGPPQRPATLTHTVRAVGRVTEAIARLKAGDLLGVRGPFGSAWPLERARDRDLVIVAGGIGLAPLRPVIYSLLADPGCCRKAILLYGARSPAEVLFAEQLREWGLGSIEVHVSVDRARTRTSWNLGTVTSLFPRISFEPEKTVGLLCGPEIMMRFAVEGFLKRGVPHESLYLSMERNMQCAVGFCGHCQFGPHFVCKDGPVFRYDTIARLLGLREV